MTDTMPAQTDTEQKQMGQAPRPAAVSLDDAAWLARRRRLAVGMVPLAVALLIAVGVAPALADGPPETVVFEAVFEDVNPCTGEDHTIYVVFTDRVHEFDVERVNRTHGNLLGTLEVTTSDGFSGTTIAAAAFNYTGEFGEEGTAMWVDLFNGVLTNPDTGQRFRFRQRLRLVIVDGAAVVDTFTSESDCLGQGGR